MIMTEDERRKLDALESLLEGLPLYPVGTVVREAQDERDKLRKKANEANDRTQAQP